MLTIGLDEELGQRPPIPSSSGNCDDDGDDDVHKGAV